MRIYELTPGGYDRVKSFYGKAKVIEKDGETLLQSYDTTVCKIDKSGEFVRMWEGYSATTMRHINAFIEMFGISGGGKKWWDALPVEEENDLPFKSEVPGVMHACGKPPRRRYDPRRKSKSNVRKTRRELLRR